MHYALVFRGGRLVVQRDKEMRMWGDGGQARRLRHHFAPWQASLAYACGVPVQVDTLVVFSCRVIFDFWVFPTGFGCTVMLSWVCDIVFRALVFRTQLC